MKQKKVYDFKMSKVKQRLVKVLKKNKNESTLADMVAGSGLPSLQVQEGIKVVLKDCRGHMKVTESGEILYYFPQGMSDKETGPLNRFKKGLNAFLKGLGKVLSFLFKIWIMVMLVGYFLFFVLILVAAIVLAIGASFADNKNRSRSSGAGFVLVARVFELFMRIWFYNSMIDSFSGRSRPRYSLKQKGPRNPMHKSVFAFVFGTEDPNKEWETKETIDILNYIRANKGVITLEEIMALTGKDFDDAQQTMNNLLIRFEGEPDVTSEGTLIYRFPQLLKTADKNALHKNVSPADSTQKQTIPFNTNPSKTNGWIGFFNGFNLLFSTYFYFNAIQNPVVTETLKQMLRRPDFSILYKLTNYMAQSIGISEPAALITIVLGIIPFIFSVIFYLVPLIRNIIRKRKNEKIKKENLNKKIYASILENPGMNSPENILGGESKKGLLPYIKKTFDRFAARKEADIIQTERKTYVYNFKELVREQKDVADYRSKVNLNSYELGETVFDSGE